MRWDIIPHIGTFMSVLGELPDHIFYIQLGDSEDLRVLNKGKRAKSYRKGELQPPHENLAPLYQDKTLEVPSLRSYHYFFFQNSTSLNLKWAVFPHWTHISKILTCSLCVTDSMLKQPRYEAHVTSSMPPAPLTLFLSILKIIKAILGLEEEPKPAKEYLPVMATCLWKG